MVTFKVKAKVGTEGAVVKAHKFILMCRSRVLCDMVKDGEGSQTLTISETEPDIFHQFLEFLYTDKTTVTIDNLEDLLFCADKYKTDLLASLCRTSLVTFISTSLVCKVMEIAQRFSDSEIIDICLKKVDEEIPKFLFTEEFLSMCPACIYKIVQRDSISAPEELIFDQVVKWSKEECSRQNILDTGENQRNVLGDILKEIRFPIMEHRYLNEVVCESGMLNDEEKVDILRQQLQIKNAGEHLFKKRERMKQQTKLTISNTTRRHLLASLHRYSLNDNEGLTLSVNYAAILVGVYLNFQSFVDEDDIENVVVKLSQEDDQSSQRFVVPLSECIADKYVKLYPRNTIKLSGNMEYTISIGFERICSSNSKRGLLNIVRINQTPMTINYTARMDFNGKKLSIFQKQSRSFDLQPNLQLICGFCMI